MSASTIRPTRVGSNGSFQATSRAPTLWVDPDDKVWLSEWAANAIVRFDPATEKFESFPSDRKNSNLRQMLGRKGATWIAESGTDRIRVIRYAVRRN
jgi:virginiamycin B lyase